MASHNIPRPEILTEPQRRRRWLAFEKLAIIEETHKPGVTVSLVARRHGIQPNQLFAWRKLATQGALTATDAVVAASDYHALQGQMRELQRLLGKKTVNAESLREALDVAAPKKRPLRMLSWPEGGIR